jgi:methionine aminopeptidase
VQGTLVFGIYAGFIDTAMTSQIDDPKARPEDVAAKTMEAIAAGREEVLADKSSQEIRAALDADPQSISREMQQIWDSGKRWA